MIDYILYFEKLKNSLLDNTVIVICGNGRYSSEKIAERLTEQNATVFLLADQDVSGKKDGACSFLNYQQTADAFKKIIEKCGKIDVLITNFFIGNSQPFEQTDYAKMEELWSNNVKKAFSVCNIVARFMKEKKMGKIINILATSGKRSYLGSSVAECSSASGLIGLSKGYAEQLAPYNISVNCIAAGLINCEPQVVNRDFFEIQQGLPLKWQPGQKLGTEDDIGYASTFLCSCFANYITGYTMDVNGGFFMD